MIFSFTPGEIDVAKSEGGLTNVVTVVRWRYSAEQGGLSESLSGLTFLGSPDPANFVELRDVTDSWLEEKVSQKINVDELKSFLAAQVIRRSGQNLVVGVQPPQG